MSSPLPPPSRADIEALLCRYDGPVPPDDLLAAFTGEPAGLLRTRAISREIDRLALILGRSLASERETSSQRHRAGHFESLAMLDLYRRLASYREFGLRLAVASRL